MHELLNILWISVHFEHCSAAIKLLHQFNPISFLLSLTASSPITGGVLQLLFKGTTIHSIKLRHAGI